MKKILFCLLLNAIGPVSAQSNFANEFTHIQLSYLDNKLFSADAITKNAASVFIFLLPDCPASQSYSLTLNELCSAFKSSGVAFYGVFPGHYNTPEEMKEYQDNYHVLFPLITDPEKKLVKSLGAKIAPEVFVVNSSGQTLYHGRIDDWMYAAGKKKLTITSHELKDALTALVHHQPPKVKATQAVGCIIE